MSDPQPPSSAIERWPSLGEIYPYVAARAEALLAHRGPLVTRLARAALSAGHGILAEKPHAMSTAVVVGACVCAGGDWRHAAWPAVAMECVMAAADVLDDVADGNLDLLPEGFSPGAALTAAAGLLALAGEAVVRGEDDDVPPLTAVALARLLGGAFARAAEGQAQGLMPATAPATPVHAYQVASEKSGPLGSLAARLGARTATDDPELVEALSQFGWHLAVHNQLLNDLRDAAPGAPAHKPDVRQGHLTVPIAFAASPGAPVDVSAEALAAWERAERDRIEATGALSVTFALAEAERLKAHRVLDSLKDRRRPVEGLVRLAG